MPADCGRPRQTFLWIDLQVAMRFYFIVLVCLFFLPFQSTLAQQQSSTATQGNTDEVLIVRLDELAKLLDKKIKQREPLQARLQDAAEGTLVDERKKLADLNRDIDKLRSTFELVALGDTNTSALTEQDEAQTTWQEDVLDIVKPLIDSLKSITKRPRQIAELRETLAETQEQMVVTNQAIRALQSIPEASLESGAVQKLADLRTKWIDEQEKIEQENLVAQSQLQRLTEDQESFFEGIWPATRLFLLGRGFTLLLSVIVALAVWCLMRLIWWVYTTRFTTKTQRRNSTWFRVVAYSYYLLTSLVIVASIIVVLYVREDLLLLALAFLIIAGTVLSFRQFLPRYIKEARLLLNLGSVREDERVLYNGLPWRIESINLNSVLRNPELDGVIRLPLHVITDMVSRPVKNNLWFPSSRGDFVILPDGMLGQIKYQTPDLVEINVRGGMSLTYNTADFYAINLINLTREDTFGVSTTFGFDYALQEISLTEIPQALYKAVHSALLDAGYEKQLKKLIVELSAASASSLDYLLFATMDSKVAGDYYRIERLLQQTCIAVSNEKGWTIPFPQLTVHQSSS